MRETQCCPSLWPTDENPCICSVLSYHQLDVGSTFPGKITSAVHHPAVVGPERVGGSGVLFSPVSTSIASKWLPWPNKQTKHR